MKCPRCQHDNPTDTRFCGQCGRELPGAGESAYPATLAYQTPGKGLERGTTFAKRFEIIEEVGHGGMGAVYKAFDSKIREFVAIKVLKPEIASDLEIIDRFRNEIKLARKVAHRHVCRMYDLNEEGQSFYITMEFVAGEDLKSFIRRSGHLNEAKALDLARQIAEGLAEAHRLGVIHRDLKPQNIMIDKDGNAKIMDFGIARSLHAHGVTSTGLVIGTPEYMSPEQAEARMVDHRSDIYSLGVILYEMVTGRVPFEGETPLSIALKHKTEPAADPTTVNTQVSSAFSRVVLRCLEKAREDRYQSAGDLLADLEGVAKGTPTPAPVVIPEMRKPITTREITVKFRLGKLLVPGIILAFVIVAVAAILSGRRHGSQETLKLSERQFTGTPGRRGYVVSPQVQEQPGSAPQGASAPPPASPEKGPLSDTSGILNMLAPVLGADVKVLEGKSVQEINAFIDNLKGKLPPDSSFAKIITNIQNQVHEGRRFSEAGNPEASKKSYTRGESEMRKLLALVNERERADRARGDMDAAKKRSEEAARRNGPNLLGWIAAEKQRDADASYQKDDFTGASILYSILASVYDLSVRGGDEDACLAALRGLVKQARGEAQAAGAPSKQGWLFSRAQDDESSAEGLGKDRQYPEAAERYIMSAFLYENARAVALESAQVGGAPK